MKNKKILLIQTGALGDVLRITPIISVLFENENIIDLITDKEYMCVVENNYKIRKKFFLDRNTFQKIVRKSSLLLHGAIYMYIYKIFEEIQEEKYDIVINFGFHKYSALVAGLASNVKEKIGLFIEGNGKEILYGGKAVEKAYTIEKGNVSQLTDLYFEMIGINNNYKREEIFINETICNNNKIPKDVVILQTGAGFKNKRYKAENWITLANTIINKYGFTILINGVKEESEQIEFIKNGINGEVYINYELSEEERIATMSKGRILISGDSGPIHIGAALDMDIIGLYGATSMYESAPYAPGKIIINSKINCSPCGGINCIYDENVCMDKIPIEYILEAIDYFITGKIPENDMTFFTAFNNQSQLVLLNC